MPRSSQPTIRRPWAALASWPGWRLALLLAFMVQCNLVQAHVHFARLANSDAISAPRQASDQPQRLTAGAPAVTSEYCLLCWEAAMAGHCVLPAAEVLPPPPVTAPWLAAAALPGFALGPPALGWLSRAPPQ